MVPAPCGGHPCLPSVAADGLLQAARRDLLLGEAPRYIRDTPPCVLSPDILPWASAWEG